MYCEMWIINALLSLGILYMLTITGASTKCIGEFPGIYIAEHIDGIYEKRNDDCILYLNATGNVDITSFFLIKEDIKDFDNVKVYDANSTNLNELMFDYKSRYATSTVFASRGPHLTIAFPLYFNRSFDLDITTIATQGSFRNNANTVSTPLFKIQGRQQYPKNLYCEYMILPHMRCTIILTVLYVDVARDPDTPDCMKMVSNNKIIYDNQCNASDTPPSTYLTTDKVSIILDSNKSGNLRGKGFSVHYTVCDEMKQKINETFELPLKPFRNSVNHIRCSYQLDMGKEGYLPIVSMRYGGQQSNKTSVQIYSGKGNLTLLADWAWNHFNETESFVGNSDNIMIVLDYDVDDIFANAILTGNFTSIMQGCNERHFSPSGQLKAPLLYGKYPNNLRCNSTIITAENTKILLYFPHMSLAWKVDNCGDYIQIYEAGSTMGERMCHLNQQLLVSTTNEIIVAFVTNNHTSDTGFTADWLSCGGQTRTNTGIFFEGAYPEYVFADNVTVYCTFKIIPKHAEYIFVEETNEPTQDNCPNETSFSNHTCKSSEMHFVMKNTTEVEYPLLQDNNYTIIWTACPQFFDETVGEILSHGYPSTVMKEMNCTYEINNRRKGQTVFMYLDYDIPHMDPKCPNSSLHIEIFSKTKDDQMNVESILLCGIQRNYVLKRDSTVKIAIRFQIADGEFGRFKARYEIRKGTHDANGTSVYKSSLISSFPWKEVSIGVGAAFVILVIIGTISFGVKRNIKKRSAGVNENTIANELSNNDPNVSSNYAMITIKCDENDENSQTHNSLDKRESKYLKMEESPYEENPAYDISRSNRLHKKEENPQSVYDSTTSNAYSQVTRDYTKKKNNCDSVKPEISDSDMDANKNVEDIMQNGEENGYSTAQDLKDPKQGDAKLDIEED